MISEFCGTNMMISKPWIGEKLGDGKTTLMKFAAHSQEKLETKTEYDIASKSPINIVLIYSQCSDLTQWRDTSV
jgi:hypothetical protein